MLGATTKEDMLGAATQEDMLGAATQEDMLGAATQEDKVKISYTRGQGQDNLHKRTRSR
jgi:hypothetical protein